MKSKFLFPAWYIIVGYLLAIPGFVLGYLNIFYKCEIPGFGFRMREKDGFIEKAFENFTNELAIFLVVVGLIFIAFSKERKEDELSAKLRLNALYWGVVVYYAIYALAMLINLIFGEIPFIGEHITEINIFTPLVIFIGRYNYLKYFNRESYLVGEPKFLPNKPFRKIGVVATLISLILFILTFISDPELDWFDLALQIGFLTMIFGTLLWGFSKNKVEDELTMQLRLESLQLAVYFNYVTLLLATLLFYSISYLIVLLFAQVSLLLFFVIRMEYTNYKNNKILAVMEGGSNHEK